MRSRISSAARTPSSECVGGSRMSTIDDVELVAVAPSQSSSASSQLPTTSKPSSLEQAREAFPQQHAVLGDRYPHGISALTRVPPPRRCPDAQPPAQRLDAVGEAAQPGSRSRCRRRRRRRRRPRRRADPVLARDVHRRRLRLRRACRCWRGSRRPRSRPRPRSARAAAVEIDVERPPGRRRRPPATSSATASPWPLTTAGWRPRATSRSSVQRDGDLARGAVDPSARVGVVVRAGPRAARGRATARSAAAARRRGGSARAAVRSFCPASITRAARALRAPRAAPSARPAGGRSRARSRPRR